jgi:uncharacterized protein
MTGRQHSDVYSSDELRDILSALVGHVGIMTPDGYPRVVPMNFAADGNTIYFHGGIHGELFTVMSASPKVTFSVDIPYSVVPSYWTSQISAGAATMLYKSILIKGQGIIVFDPDEKIAALRLITEKYQPEGGYKPITRDEPTYHSLLKGTAVYRINPDRIDVRINLRQKKSVEYRRKLIERLEHRAQGPDLATADVIRNMLSGKG